MANKRRGGLTTVMDIAMAGVLALVPVAVVGSWWVGALVFGIGAMWALRPREESVEPGWKKVVRENKIDDEDDENEWMWGYMGLPFGNWWHRHDDYED